ncbi:hypothetical protein BBP23_00040 [Chlamydia trachomatis]|uniref:DUF5422 family protein n=1 Tax=Chlamydia trachomatis TaxID=813 RepID=UPI00084C4F75|nr:DUF5422 family protein [Chlamydia trachomatis]AOQ15498.1 hypothetical protein BBP23_00040 [Chlamydia trachomatis]AOQ17087.1 hypothetical protein BBV14_00035 [Chlamydia trachomatis]AOQ17906.1 hypothetical protein BBV15_00035 [Chlamydia trachomatis]
MPSTVAPIKGQDHFLNLVFPERVAAAYMSPLAQKYPKAALSIASLAGFLLGILKLITFPVLCAAGLFVFPIRGLISCLFHKSFQSCSGYVLATFLSLFSLALTIVGIVSCITWAPGFIFPMISVSIAFATVETCFQIYTHLFPALEHKPSSSLKIEIAAAKLPRSSSAPDLNYPSLPTQSASPSQRFSA